MNSNKPKILIISSDTGGGHRSAAAAIVAQLSGWDVNPAEHYDAKSHLRWTVRANQCLEYSLYATFTGDAHERVRQAVEQMASSR